MAEECVEERLVNCVRGYHFYNGVWTAILGEILCCARETGNVVDYYVVSIVGHLPRKYPKFVPFFFDVVVQFHAR